MKIAYAGLDMLMPAMEYLRDSGHEILKIYTCKSDNKTEFNTSIIDYAKKNDIPWTTDRIRLKDLDEMKTQGCEMLVCGWYYYLIPTPDNYEENYFPMLNIHPAILPRWRGVWPIPFIIRDGYEEAGVSIIKITEKMDEGDIVLQESFKLTPVDNHRTYIDKSLVCTRHMLERLMKNPKEVIAASKPQGEGIYWAAPTEEDNTIRPDMKIAQADKILRGFYGYECYYVDSKKYEIINGRVCREEEKNNLDASNENKKYVFLELEDGYIKVDRDLCGVVDTDE